MAHSQAGMESKTAEAPGEMAMALIRAWGCAVGGAALWALRSPRPLWASLEVGGSSERRGDAGTRGHEDRATRGYEDRATRVHGLTTAL